MQHGVSSFSVAVVLAIFGAFFAALAGFRLLLRRTVIPVVFSCSALVSSEEKKNKIYLLTDCQPGWTLIHHCCAHTHKHLSTSKS